MKEKTRRLLKNILTVTAIITVLFATVPPIPTQGGAGVIEGINAAQIILEGLAILSGVQIVNDGLPSCVCVSINCDKLNLSWLTGFECVSAGQLTLDELMRETLNSPTNINADAHVMVWNSLVEQAEKIIENYAKSKDVDFLEIAEGIINKQAPLPSPPGSRPPWWPVRLIGGAGVVTAPFIIFRTNIDEAEEILSMNKYAKQERMIKKGFYICTETKKIKPINEPKQPRAIIGYRGEIPVIRRMVSLYPQFPNGFWRMNEAGGTIVFEQSHGWVHEEIQIEVMESLKNNVIINGVHYEVKIIGTRFDGMFFTAVYRDGVRWLHGAESQNLSNLSKISMGFAYLDNDTELSAVVMSYERTGSNYRYRASSRQFNINYEQPITEPKANPTPEVNLAPINALTNLEELIELIRQIAYHPDLKENEIVITLPLLEPQFFPDVPPEHFAEFAREILNNLTIEHIIMPGHEAVKIINEVPEINIPKPTDYTRHLEEIERRLREQNQTLERIEIETREVKRGIGELILGSPSDLDFSPIRELGAISGVFPFSIPWDLRNAFEILFGHGWKVDAPKFEIDLTDTILNYKMEIDFNDYEVMAAVIRWGIMSMFVFGLIMGTGRLIKW
jgi:hypothetical protein